MTCGRCVLCRGRDFNAEVAEEARRSQRGRGEFKREIREGARRGRGIGKRKFGLFWGRKGMAGLVFMCFCRFLLIC